MIGPLHLLILVASVLAGGLLVPLFGLRNGKGLKLLLSYSGAYILAICLFHLIPEVYGELSGLRAGWMVLCGFLLQLLLDYISGGIEHGHVHLHGNGHAHHDHGEDHTHHHPALHTFPVMMMLGLCIHSFTEGLPLMYGNAQYELFIGIILHNIPISIVLMSVFLASGRSLLKSFGALLLFALMTPAGALAARFFFDTNPERAHTAGHYALALVIGIFLHIGTTILFEADKNHRFNLAKLVTVLLGIVTAFLLN